MPPTAVPPTAGHHVSNVPGRFGAVLTAMATPFGQDGALDLDGAATLARWLATHGSDGLVVAGTTGEVPTLSDDEKSDLWRAVAEAVTIPVVAGSGTADTAHSIRLTHIAEGAGASAALVVAPYYSRPSQAGLAAHFEAVASATRLPVVIYDIPARTGRKVDTSTLLGLAHRCPNIVAVKDAAANPSASASLLAKAPGGFELYSGDDAMTLPLLAVGACGVIGVATHWAGPEMAEMLASFAKGDVDAARVTNARLVDSYAFETCDEAPNPVPTKAMLRVLGLPGGPCRPPMGPEPDGLEDRARALLAGLAAHRP
ncbi:MAG: 4-hydroxy-tetrahydrodipicolinate synthase [Acidimicrobiales bacterium]